MWIRLHASKQCLILGNHCDVLDPLFTLLHAVDVSDVHATVFGLSKRSAGRVFNAARRAIEVFLRSFHRLARWHARRCNEYYMRSTIDATSSSDNNAVCVVRYSAELEHGRRRGLSEVTITLHRAVIRCLERVNTADRRDKEADTMLAERLHRMCGLGRACCTGWIYADETFDLRNDWVDDRVDDWSNLCDSEM